MVDEGYTPFLQVPHFSGKIDFLGVNSNECIIIESKISKWKCALKQAIRYGYGADKAFVALPSSVAIYVANNFKNQFEQYQVGLLEICENCTNMLIESDRKVPSPVFKRILLRQVSNRQKESRQRVTELIERYR
jgi:hypothetical protein